MKYFDFEICGLKRKLPYVEVAENLALASFVCLSDTELVQTVAPELVKRLPPVDYLMTAEAKGICLTYEMSRIMGMKEFIVARKSRKPYLVNSQTATTTGPTLITVLSSRTSRRKLKSSGLPLPVCAKTTRTQIPTTTDSKPTLTKPVLPSTGHWSARARTATPQTSAVPMADTAARQWLHPL